MRILVDRLTSVDAEGKCANYMEIACDSSEISNLPTTGIADGSSALITNTAEVYFFNEKTSAWIKA